VGYRQWVTGNGSQTVGHRQWATDQRKNVPTSLKEMCLNVISVLAWHKSIEDEHSKSNKVMCDLCKCMKELMGMCIKHIL